MQLKIRKGKYTHAHQLQYNISSSSKWDACPNQLKDLGVSLNTGKLTDCNHIFFHQDDPD